MGDVQKPIHIPSGTVQPDGDLLTPIQGLLQGVNLLGNPIDADGSLLTSPPQSVAVIEAGVTAATKAWTAGAGAAIVAAWTSVKLWLPKEPAAIQHVVIGGAAVVTAVLIASIAYMVGSDVRGRAAASVATIAARAKITASLIQAAENAAKAQASSTAGQMIALPTSLGVKYKGDDGWLAVAIAPTAGGVNDYVIVKGASEVTATPDQLIFNAPPAMPATDIIPLPASLGVKFTARPSADEDGWQAIAIERDASGALKYVVVKEAAQQSVDVSALDFVAAIPQASAELIPLPTPLRVKYVTRASEDEDGWSAIAIVRADESANRYLIVKGSTEATVESDELVFQL